MSSLPNEETCDKFFNIISKLLKELASAYRNDVDIITLQRRFSMARETVPLELYNKIGTFLTDYVDEIIELDQCKDFSFFLNAEYTQHYKGKKEESLAESVIFKVKSLLMGKPKSEQETYIRYIITLLELYTN